METTVEYRTKPQAPQKSQSGLLNTPVNYDNMTIDDMTGDLVELERKLIPLLNRVRTMLGKPAVIVPK